jgi:hypothetical protein
LETLLLTAAVLWLRKGRLTRRYALPRVLISAACGVGAILLPQLVINNLLNQGLHPERALPLAFCLAGLQVLVLLALLFHALWKRYGKGARALLAGVTALSLACTALTGAGWGTVFYERGKHTMDLLLPEVKVPGFWERARASDDYKFMRDSLLAEYEAFSARPLEVLKYSDYKQYDANGSRAAHESAYFERRRRLHVSAMLALIYDGREYIETLQDVIWAVCDEYDWVVPAHRGHSIDLFAAGTGFALSEIYSLLGDRLDSAVIERLKAEVTRRVITPFEQTAYFRWEGPLANWSAVCAAGVAACYFYIAPERFGKVQKRLVSALECFLESYTSDGACLEGIGYWVYGFGHFVDCAQLLKEFTGGKIDLLADEKVAQIARFQERASLMDGVYISFADAHAEAEYSIYPVALNYFLHKSYGVSINQRGQGDAWVSDNDLHWAEFIRAFAWYDPGAASAPAYEDFYFDQSGIFVAKRPGFSFAAKGGHNDEPHNHNDVGNFIFAAGGRQVLCDVGPGEYNKKYFSAERYELLPTSSRGHSVPVINGKYQQNGAQFKGEVLRADENLFSVEMAGAYGIPALESLARTFELSDNGVTITDGYVFSAVPESVVERLVALVEPEVGDGWVKVDGVTVRFSPDFMDCAVTRETLYEESRGPAVYLIDFTVKAPQLRMETKLELAATR